MGCDIHLCVEKRRIKKGWFVDSKRKPNSYNEYEKVFKLVIEEPKEWSSCLISSRKPWSCREYDVFAKLANVRNCNNLEHLPIRGFPKDANIRTFWDYALRVVPDSDYDEKNYDTIPESEANDWIKHGYSKEITIQNMPPHWKDYRFITSPDYHSANWCSLQELEQAVKEVFFEEEIGDYTSGAEEWLALVGYMKGLEIAGFETRIVFWFDN